MAQQSQQGAKSIWGKVVLYLKEHRLISLYIACGDIIDVAVNDEKFVINTESQLLYSILTDKQNYEFLKNAFNWQGFTGEIHINKLVSMEEKINQDLKKFKDLSVEVDLKIIDD